MRVFKFLNRAQGLGKYPMANKIWYARRPCCQSWNHTAVWWEEKRKESQLFRPGCCCCCISIYHHFSKYFNELGYIIFHPMMCAEQVQQVISWQDRDSRIVKIIKTKTRKSLLPKWQISRWYTRGTNPTNVNINKKHICKECEDFSNAKLPQPIGGTQKAALVLSVLIAGW